MKKYLVIFMLGVFLFSHAISVSASPSMQVSLAQGTVTLNGQIIDNEHAQYPLLMYSNITYFPMTYNLCRFLGVSTDWNNETRTLTVAKTGSQGQYIPDKGTSPVHKTQTVYPVTDSIIVNNVPIDNGLLHHKIFRYNNIIYFPLTYEFSVDFFGWESAWDSENGLRINSHSASVQPAVPINSGSKEFDTILQALSNLYQDGGQYQGILSSSNTIKPQTFYADIIKNFAGADSVFTLDIEADIFSESPIQIQTFYKNNNLDSPPHIQQSFIMEKAGTASETSLIPPENFTSSPKTPELGYLSECLFDCQFTGSRTDKISSFKKVSETDNIQVWQMNIIFSSNNYPGFSHYDVEAVYDNKKNKIKQFSIETSHYTLTMIPTV